ncbi:hypothetical protein D3C85_1825200 [compost metagenome]
MAINKMGDGIQAAFILKGEKDVDFDMVDWFHVMDIMTVRDAMNVEVMANRCDGDGRRACHPA